MKHLKMLGLLLVAAASLMASGESASGATFTSPAGTEYTGSFDMSLESSWSERAGFAEFTCTESTIKGEITTNNEEHATGPTTAVSFSKCTSPQGTPTVTTLSSKGTITIAKATTAVSATGIEVTSSHIGTSCVYGFGTGTSLGTAKNTEVGGKGQVTLPISAKMTKISGGFLCASPEEVTGSYVFTSPAPSVVD